MLSSTIGMADAERLVLAVGAAGGSVPDDLTNILNTHDLLKRASRPSDPADSFAKQARRGEVTEESLASILADGATAEMVANYAGSFRGQSEHLLLQEFYEALTEGAADHILDSLRSPFDEAAARLGQIRELVPTDGPAEDFLNQASPAAVKAWQQLDTCINKLDQIGYIASQFGPRTAAFALIEEYTLADNFHLHDRAIFCSTGDLERDSQVFQSPGVHRTSPWFRIGGLKLSSVAEARERYRVFAADQWEHLNGGRVVQRYTDNGELEDVVIPNPYCEAKAVS